MAVARPRRRRHLRRRLPPVGVDGPAVTRGQVVPVRGGLPRPLHRRDVRPDPRPHRFALAAPAHAPRGAPPAAARPARRVVPDASAAGPLAVLRAAGDRPGAVAGDPPVGVAMVEGARRHRPRLRACDRAARPVHRRGAGLRARLHLSRSEGSRRRSAGGSRRSPRDFLPTSAGLSAVNALDALYLGDGARALHWYEQLAAGAGEQPGSGATRSPPPAGGGAADHARRASQRATCSRSPRRCARSWPATRGRRSRCTRSVVCASSAVTTARPRPLEGAAFLAEINELVGAPGRTAPRHEASSPTSRATEPRPMRPASEPLRSSTRWPADLPPTTAMTDALAAISAARAGKRDVAADRLEVGRAKLVAFNSVAPWFNILCRLGARPGRPPHR